MTARPAALDPLRFPLHGSRLIEASAGTGKTYTIAALYVRLVLGHGGEAAFTRALTPPEILVVTFTDAATQELRDRIRRRLAEAAEVFRADPDDPAPRGDELLLALRDDYPPEAWAGCARKLQLAAEWMDEAAVSTIHGWCNRMLREHAFDSDSLFTQSLETDQRDLLAEVVRDYWRSFIAPLDAEAAAEARAWWSGPQALQDEVRGLVAHADGLGAAPAPAESLHTAAAERRRVLAELKSPWIDWADVLRGLCDEAVAAKRVDGRKLQARHYQSWCDALRDWAADPALVRPALTETAWARLTQTGLAEIWKDGEPPRHEAIEAFGRLTESLNRLPEARHDVLRHAAAWIAERFDAEQARRAQMGFDDLLTRLDAALAGPNGARLAEVIRRQFPVALIDEFQDTDPVQYRIFDAVYRIADNDAATALVLIGDPKQAIYAFRGADIFTYLAARRACAERLYTLGRNFRSTQAMVAATNRCFEAAETRERGRGAFLFREDGENPVPFLPADANDRRERLVIDGEAPEAALTAWWLGGDGDKPLGKTAYLQAMAAACATEMVRLLDLGQRGRAGFAREGELRPLRPADLAVLVNNRTEADAIRWALAARGVRSVYLSDKDSVFQSPQAAEMQHWLAACAEPDDPRLLRAALATPTLALDWDALDALQRDELLWEERVLQFRGYRECWRRQGVLPMLRRLLQDFDVPARLLAPAAPDAAVSGERVLTDILHLAELLQQASVLLDGEHALIRHLAEQRAEAERAGGAGDARQIRLESDADIVQVVTVHKSKGLEYPLVFLPFACTCRPVDAPRELPLVWHDAAGRLQLSLEADAQILAAIDRERLGEELRKLYVALTRARHATWVGVAPLADLHRSAFGYLMRGGDAIPAGELVDALDALRGDCDAIAVQPAPVATSATFRPAAPEVPAAGAREPVRPVREHWWIASYSALGTADGQTSSASAADTPDEDVVLETLAEPIEAAPPEDEPPARAAAARQGLHDFPRGATAGTFLHDLLEWAATEGFARVAADRALLHDTVARRCNVRGWARHIEPVTDWLLGLLATPLRLPPVQGAAVAPVTLTGLHACVAEMEFWMAAHDAPAEAIDRLVCAHTLGGAPRPALQPRQLNGMLKGFIDLVFEHEGRYYVADYKSNWLGPDDAAYTPPAMQATILAARYELQYALYLFALHRLLKARLPDYDYDRHVGGAVYLFLRGTAAPSQGVHVERPPRALVEGLDALFSRGGR